MNLESLTINIRDKEYTFLKPTASTLINIEDNSYADGSYNESTFNTEILRLVSPKLKEDMFITERLDQFELSTGDIITPKSVAREFIIKKKKEIIKERRGTFAKEFLKICGVGVEPDLSKMTYNDINGMALAFAGLYDETELNEVVDKIYTFCFGEDMAK